MLTSLTAAAWQETFEHEAVRRKAGDAECGHGSVGPRDGNDRQILGQSGTDEPESRITDCRYTGIADERKRFALLQTSDQRRCLLLFVMLVKSDKWAIQLDTR